MRGSRAVVDPPVLYAPKCWTGVARHSAQVRSGRWGCGVAGWLVDAADGGGGDRGWAGGWCGRFAGDVELLWSAQCGWGEHVRAGGDEDMSAGDGVVFFQGAFAA